MGREENEHVYLVIVVLFIAVNYFVVKLFCARAAAAAVIIHSIHTIGIFTRSVSKHLLLSLDFIPNSTISH
jgi:hypothetical protein